MNQELVPIHSTTGEMIEKNVMTEEQIDLIKSTIAKDSTAEELKLFLYHCKKTGLDPLARQIYFQKRRNKKTGKDMMTILTGIDGYRLIAHRTGQHAGIDATIFDDEKNPRKADVTVYKLLKGIRCPFTASARWDQYYPGDTQGFIWNKMPHLMLEKCAEALALRKAFPNELSGIYTQEEMEQSEELPKEPETPAKPPVKTLAVLPAKTKEPAKAAVGGSFISKGQVSRLWAIAHSKEWSNDQVRDLLASYDYEHTADILKEDYDDIIKDLEK